MIACEVNEMTEEQRNLTEQEPALQEEEVFVPSPRRKRIAAWFLFAIVALSLCTWLVSIAFPDWIDAVVGWVRRLFS